MKMKPVIIISFISMIVNIIVITSLFILSISPLFIDNVVNVIAGSMENPNKDSIDEGDLVIIEDANKIATYVDGGESDYRKAGSYGDVIIYRPNGETDRTAIIHRAVVYIEWNDTTYNLPIPIADLDDDLREDLNRQDLSADTRADLNKRIGEVNRMTVKNLCDRYPNDVNHDTHVKVIPRYDLDHTLSTFLNFMPFSDAVVIDQITTTRWSITEGDQRFEIAEADGGLVIYAFLRFGGGFDIDSMNLDPDQRGEAVIRDYEWPRENDLVIDLAEILESFREVDKDPHSGYITKGDMNSGIDQTATFFSADQPSWIEPVEEEWIIGKYQGKIGETIILGPSGLGCLFFSIMLSISIPVFIGSLITEIHRRNRVDEKSKPKGSETGFGSSGRMVRDDRRDRTGRKPIREERLCYYTTPESQRRWIRQLVYIYDGKGNLKLTRTHLLFDSGKEKFNVPIRKIVAVGIGRFRRNQKPITLNYLIIRYQDSKRERKTIYLIPAGSPLRFVWNTNKNVKLWLKDILSRTTKVHIIESDYTRGLIR